jgi:hypothetical protein
VPVLSAPVPAPAPGTSPGVTEPGPAGAEPGDGPPIFESVRSGYRYAFGRDPMRLSGQQDGQPPARRPARPPAPWGNGSGRAAAGPPATGRPASSGLPRRIPPRTPPGQVRGPAADQETQQAPAAESAEITRSKLASFQDGSRRARMVAQLDRGGQQPERDR